MAKYMGSVTALAAMGGLFWYAQKSIPKKKLKPTDSNFAVTEEFQNMFPKLADILVKHLVDNYQLDDKLQQRVRWLLNYNILGGKLYRGGLTVSIVQQLCLHRSLDYNRYKDDAAVLGWCIEILQACFLVADDVMDKSLTRRGQLCWYKQPSIQFDAVNDSLILESFIFILLKKYFSNNPTLHLKFLDLYHQMLLTTEMGQMLDLVAQPQGAKSSNVLDNFIPSTYKKIIQFKTACYTFYLSAAVAMTLTGYEAKEDFDIVYRICLKLGEKFQIQDDYLDAFGKPEVLGKIGTDIQDHKCTWLCIEALKRMNAQQRNIYNACYGKEDEQSVESVKQLYRDLNLPEVYHDNQQVLYDECIVMINSANTRLPADAMFLPILKKLHGRDK